MKLHLNLFLLILTIIFITGCDKDPTGPRGSGFIYPLKVGNQWEYDRTFSTFNFRPDSSNDDQYNDINITSSVIIEIIRREPTPDSIDVFVFQETLNENDRPLVSNSFYANLDSGLYFYGNSGPAYVTPKASLNNRFLFKGRYFNNIREITSYITNAVPKNYILIGPSMSENPPPLQSLKYPIYIGSQWTFRNSGNPWLIDKKIINYEKVTVPVGSFVCIKVQWLFDIDTDNVWDEDIIFYDYICKKGLIKRSIVFKDIIATGELNPEPLGLIDVRDESILTKLTL